MLSLLGIKQVVVCVNKMDLVDYSEQVFLDIKKEYSAFLKDINLVPKTFIPISAREGDNVASLSTLMPWYTQETVLEIMDSFKKEEDAKNKPFRFPLQDVYKFTDQGDDRRIFAGRIETGQIKKGDEVIFYPSEKTSRIRAIEGFALKNNEFAYQGQSTGFTLETQIYVKPGEIMCKKGDTLCVGSRFRVNLFWLGRRPMLMNKQYKLKLGTNQVPVWLESVNHVLDASDLVKINDKEEVGRHDVADCILQTYKPIAFDLVSNLAVTSRFVIVDDYEIAGGGIITEDLVLLIILIVETKIGKVVILLLKKDKVVMVIFLQWYYLLEAVR